MSRANVNVAHARSLRMKIACLRQTINPTSFFMPCVGRVTAQRSKYLANCHMDHSRHRPSLLIDMRLGTTRNMN